MYTKIRFAPALIAALVAGAVFAADKPVAVVNGVAIPQSQMDYILKQLSERGAKDSPELRAKLRDELVTKEVLAQEAAKKGLDKDADVQMDLTFAKQNVMVKAFVNNYQKSNPVSDDALKAEYDRLKAQMPSKEYHVRHILVKTEAEANTILGQLKKGKKFEDLAKTKSEDPGSKANGGDLGWAVPTSFVPEFGDAMTKLAKGQISQAPVKSKFGYHIIQVEDTRTPQGPSFDEVKAGLQQQMQNQSLDKLVADLKAKAKVE